jgi:glycosyltransferase involved in cell wall biosynthesis
MTEAQARALLERLRASPRPRVLFVTHGERGGVARHVSGLAEAISDERDVLVLKPHEAQALSLSWASRGETLELFLHPDRDWEKLLGLLRALGIGRIHVHHVHGLPRSILDLPARLDVPYDVTLHDYFPACPNYHLTAGDGRYCASDPGCKRCLEKGPAAWGGSVADWRAAFRPFLQHAARVIAPSEDTARRITAFYPDSRVVTWPHPEPAAEPAQPPVRVLVPGAISLAKGMDVLEACVADAKARDLPIHFRVLGFVARKLALWPETPVSIRGEYPEGRLAELVAIERGDAFFFPSQCPETFSYTLSAALDSGLPILATDLGAFPERLAAVRDARVMPWRSSAADLNDALLALALRTLPATSNRARVSFDEYRQRYLAEPPRTLADAPPLPAIDPGWLAQPHAAAERLPLAYLYEDGVVCGKARSLEGLRRYAFDPDSLYADADARVRELIEARAADAEKLRRIEAGGALTALARWIRSRFA